MAHCETYNKCSVNKFKITFVTINRNEHFFNLREKGGLGWKDAGAFTEFKT